VRRKRKGVSVGKKQTEIQMNKGEILVIPDPHDEPNVSKERFGWLGNLIVDRLPDTVVCLGDGLSLDSLSSYDKGTVHSEGKRYNEDVDSFLEAMDTMFQPIESFNRARKKQHRAKYKPLMIYCEGNHENRITKAINSDPKLIGTMSIRDLELEERGWEYYPLTQPAKIHGVAFAHYFTSGIMGRPISGINHARSLVNKTYTNTVVGHSHDRSFWEDTNIFGDKVLGLVAGCYFEHDLAYTREERRNWPGLVYLRTGKREVDPEFISLDRVKKEWR
jgi:hypothetical protein